MTTGRAMRTRIGHTQPSTSVDVLADGHAGDGLGVPNESSHYPASGQVPQLKHVIVATRESSTPVRAHDDKSNGVGVPREGSDFLSGRQVPELERLVVAT